MNYTVFSQRLAGFLMQKGFVLVGIDRSDRNDGRNVFFFKQTQELMEAIDEYRRLAA